MICHPVDGNTQLIITDKCYTMYFVLLITCCLQDGTIPDIRTQQTIKQPHNSGSIHGQFETI